MSDLCLFLKYFFLRCRSNISIMNKLWNALTTYPARQLQKLSHAALLDQIMFYEGSSPQLSIIKFISGHISLLGLNNTLTCLPTPLQTAAGEKQEESRRNILTESMVTKLLLESKGSRGRYLFILRFLCPLLLCPFHTFTYFAWHGLL